MNLIEFSRWQIGRITRYGLVGLVNTAVSASIMTILAYLSVNYVIYTVVAYLTAMSVSFALNLKFTFRADGFLLKRFLSFLTINLTNLALVVLLEIYLIEYHKVQHIYAVIAGMVWYVVFGFIMNQCLAFRKYHIKDRYA